MATHSVFLLGKSHGQRSLAGSLEEQWQLKQVLEHSQGLMLWASLVAQLVKKHLPVEEMRLQSWDWEDPLEKEMLLTPVF